MQKHNDDTIKTSGHSSLEKYTSHFIRKGYERVTKGIIVWEVSWRLNRTATYWPPNSSGYSSISFPFSRAAQPGGSGPSLCWDMVFIPASSRQLIWTSCRRGYTIIWRPPTSCQRHNSHSIQLVNSQGYPPISSTGCTCYLHRCISYFDSSAGGQYVTIVGSFGITVVRAVKKPSFIFIQLSTPFLSLKSSFSVKMFFFPLYTADKETLTWFRH